MTRVDLFSSLTHRHDNDDMIQTASQQWGLGMGGSQSQAGVSGVE